MDRASLQLELERLEQRHREHPEGRLFAPLADCLRKLDRLDDALQTCRVGLQRHPRYSSAYVILGKIHLARGEAEAAREAFSEVLQLDPHNLLALRHLALDCEERGHHEEAVARWSQLLTLEPTNDEAQEHLDRLRETATASPGKAPGSEPGEQPETATEECPEEQVVELEPMASAAPSDDAEDVQERPPSGSDVRTGAAGEIATITLADIYYEQGFKEKALTIYRSVEGRHPGLPGVAERIHRIDQELKDLQSRLDRSSPGGRAPDAHLDELESVGYAEGVLSAGLVEEETEPPPTDQGGVDRGESERFDHFRTWLDRIKVRDS